MRQDLWRGRELHFIAIGGAGMSGLAAIAHGLGAAVTGSDRAESSYLERLRGLGLEPRIGHDADQVPEGAEVVVSTAIGDDNPELAIARERGQRVLHRSELLAELCELRRVLAVAGAHGKTTTAGMIAHAWRAAGEDVGFVIGGELPTPAGPANSGWGESEWLVVEADESDGSFLRLAPEVVAVTNVELDHHDRWAGLSELIEAFEHFADGARAVVLGSDDERLGAIGAGAERRVADPAAPLPTLRVPGRHNRANAALALSAIDLAGGPVEAAREALADFPGIVRRMQSKGKAGGGIEVYDDYAHHPTEVAAALEAARELDGGRLVAIFQPHLYSRTKELGRAFGRALAGADAIGVLEVYPAREKPVGPLAGISGIDVARAAADAAPGRPVWWLGGLSGAADRVSARLRPGDMVITLGAGDVYRLGEELVEGAGER